MSIVHPFHHLIMPNKTVLANPFVPDFHEPSPGRSAGHDPAGAVNGGEQRLARDGRVDSLDNHGVVAHAAADKTFLSGKSRRRTLAHNPVSLSVVRFAPGKVVMVVHFLENFRAENLARDVTRHRFASGVSITTSQMHPGEIIAPNLGILFNHCW